MKLPDDVFASISGIEARQLGERRSERRDAGRVPLPARFYIIPVTKPLATKPILVHVRDISQEGIGLVVPLPFAVGNELLVRLQSKELRLWVLCAVVRVDQVGTTLFVVGAKFTRIVEPYAVAAQISATGVEA